MRVALILLFLLSLGAIPGSLIPQSSNDELKVQDFKAKHTTVAPLYDKLQLFHVYSSVWFSAIYILLFISLIGCIIPRTWQFVGQLRGRPAGGARAADPAARVHHLAHHRGARGRPSGRGRDAQEAPLPGRGDRRLGRRGEGLSARDRQPHLPHRADRDAGVLRRGQLFNSEGGKLVVEGDGFSNTLTQYDDFKSGSLFDTDDLAPFSFTLSSFTGTYERSGPEVGRARSYEPRTSPTPRSPGTSHAKRPIEVNKPLEVDGSKVYLISHGYAPVVTVKDGRGKVVFHGATPLLPIDANGSLHRRHQGDGRLQGQGRQDATSWVSPRSSCRPTDRRPGRCSRSSPALDFPVLNVGAYHGDLGVDSGLPAERVPARHQQAEAVQGRQGQAVEEDAAARRDTDASRRRRLDHHGQGDQGVGELPDLAPARHDLRPRPARSPPSWAWPALCSSSGAGSGSGPHGGADGVTVVEMAGLGRSESARLPEELGDLAVTLIPQARRSRPTAGSPDSVRRSRSSILPRLLKGLRSESRRRSNEREPGEHQQCADLFVDGRLHAGLLRAHGRVAVRQPKQGRPHGRRPDRRHSHRGRRLGSGQGHGQGRLHRRTGAARRSSPAPPRAPGTSPTGRARTATTHRATCTAGWPSPSPSSPSSSRRAVYSPAPCPCTGRRGPTCTSSTSPSPPSPSACTSCCSLLKKNIRVDRTAARHHGPPRSRPRRHRPVHRQ